MTSHPMLSTEHFLTPSQIDESASLNPTPISYRSCASTDSYEELAVQSRFGNYHYLAPLCSLQGASVPQDDPNRANPQTVSKSLSSSYSNQESKLSTAMFPKILPKLAPAPPKGGSTPGMQAPDLSETARQMARRRPSRVHGGPAG